MFHTYSKYTYINKIYNSNYIIFNTIWYFTVKLYSFTLAYLLAGICTFQEILLLGALFDVTIFQSHPDISPRVPVIRKFSTESMHATS